MQGPDSIPRSSVRYPLSYCAHRNLAQNSGYNRGPIAAMVIGHNKDKQRWLNSGRENATMTAQF